MATEMTGDDLKRSHQWHAIECNNRAWDLGGQSSRTKEENEEMLNAAHAAAFHWQKVGTELHNMRAKMLLAHVHAALGMGPTALALANETFNYFTTHESPDWEIAFTHAILAQAAMAAGEDGLYREQYAKASQLGDALADPEDKNIFLQTFNTIPAP